MVKCSIEGCPKPAANVRGWCHAHYWRWRHYGDPLGGGPAQLQRHGMTPYERVMAMSEPSSTGCRLFTGAKNRRGYGHLGHNGRTVYAHRVVLEHHRGPSPLEAMHTCDTPSCVEIEHLRYGTRAENVEDSIVKGRHFTPFRH